MKGAICILACLAGACAGSKLSVEGRPLYATPSYAPTDPASIVIYAGEREVVQRVGLKRRFRTIGVLHWRSVNRTAKEIDAALREEAAALGAEGVLKRLPTVIPHGLFGRDDMFSGYADAIRFEEKPTADVVRR